MTTVGLVGLHPDLSSLVAEIFRDEGMSSLPFPLHGETPALLAKVHIDALVVDGHPYSNIVALVDALRQQSATAKTPIVVLTALEQPALHHRHGPVTQVLMPFAVDTFLAAVQAALQRSP
jgi:DNA-binding response OmpR family regulator